jgi:hypothetical protein
MYLTIHTRNWQLFVLVYLGIYVYVCDDDLVVIEACRGNVTNNYYLLCIWLN